MRQQPYFSSSWQATTPKSRLLDRMCWKPTCTNQDVTHLCMQTSSGAARASLPAKLHPRSKSSAP